jgi:hypothetical protein
MVVSTCFVALGHLNLLNGLGDFSTQLPCTSFCTSHHHRLPVPVCAPTVSSPSRKGEVGLKHVWLYNAKVLLQDSRNITVSVLPPICLMAAATWEHVWPVRPHFLFQYLPETLAFLQLLWLHLPSTASVYCHCGHPRPFPCPHKSCPVLMSSLQLPSWVPFSAVPSLTRPSPSILTWKHFLCLTWPEITTFSKRSKVAESV